MLTDIKYLSFLSSRLRNFKKKNDRLWNCSCPLCGDSTNDERKARGYFFPHKNRLIYKCHKCGVSVGFSNFLRSFDANLFSEYRMERVGRPKPKKEFVAPASKMKERLKEAHERSVLDSLTPIQHMPLMWQQYLVGRKIPMNMLRKYFFYTETFKAFANTINKDSFSKKSLRHEETRIVIPFFDEQGKVYCIQGRETLPSYAKYVTIKKDEDSNKVFGIDRIDRNEEVYVVEGPIDSMLIDNAVAVCGADLVTGAASVEASKTYIFDNEPRSKIAQKKIGQAIEGGEKVVIFPPTVHQKDINDMAKAGHDVNGLIKEHTHKGLAAKLELGKWSR